MRATPTSTSDASGRKAEPLFPLPLVGRESELATLASRLDAAHAGRGGTTLLAGAGGIGKSRLVAAMADRAERQQWTTSIGRANPVETGVPYAIFADALAPIVRSLSPSSLAVLARGDAASLASICPAFSATGAPVPAGDAGDAKARLFWTFTQFLTQLPAQRPVLLVLENLQWADASSLELLHFESMRAWMFSSRGILTIGALSLLISAVLLAVFIPRERAAKAQAAFEHEQARVAAAERQATLARLKLLEAQIEPHFLYNTLANVVSLIDTDPATAKRMQERLITLLRGAAAAAGNTDPTLSAQIEHLRAYLDLMAMRMGRRLAFRLDVPNEVRGVRLPSLLLQPLVENAIRHGLEPKVEGGDVLVSARRDGDELMLVVADTGIGFPTTQGTAAPGTGLGLANLRERLATLYGTRSTLTIEDNAPAGTRVTLRVPLPADS